MLTTWAATGISGQLPAHEFEYKAQVQQVFSLHSHKQYALHLCFFYNAKALPKNLVCFLFLFYSQYRPAEERQAGY